MIHCTEFEVSGSGLFPVDMLRYDQCYPLNPEVIFPATGDPSTLRKVKLQRLHSLKDNAHITLERWSSFGWFVTNIRTFK